MVVILAIFVPSFIFADEKSSPGGFVYNDHGARDPLVPLVDSTGTMLNYGNNLSIADLGLEGIMIGSDGENLAIVNGSVLQKGDVLGEFVVFEIQSDGVIFDKNNEKFELRLKKEESDD